ncbi:MAG: DUF3073 domain-containing protein [Nostocoides sp.]
MGRGRAKAKQTKVARALKYSTPDTDFNALEQELHGSGNRWNDATDSGEADVDKDYDDYDKWASSNG